MTDGEVALVKGMSEILEQPVTWDVTLADTGMWDSLAFVATMALLSDMGVEVDVAKLRACVTVADLFGLLP